MSVYRTLERDLPGHHIFHTHYLNPETTRVMDAAFRRFFKHKGWVWFYDEIFGAKLLHKRLQAKKPSSPKWKVVALVRDPVARNVSSFFQHLQFNFPTRRSADKKNPDKLQELTQLFVLDSEGTHNFPLTWFHKEVRDVFGIDVFEKPFPHEQGFEIYEGEKADLLVIRLEDLDTCGAVALERFFGLKNVDLLTVNKASGKQYDSGYKGFKAALKLPATYLDRMYSSRLARHFYQPHEIEIFRSKWTATDIPSIKPTFMTELKNVDRAQRGERGQDGSKDAPLRSPSVDGAPGETLD